MTNSEKILSELRELSPLIASISKRNVFSVPNDYFLRLPQSVMIKVEQQNIPSVNGNVYSVPADYFDNFSDSVLVKLKAETNEVAKELQEIAPFLNSIQKENPYSVPVNYFKNFAVKKDDAPAAKIVLFSKSRKWITYAAAAVIAGVLITGVFVNQNIRSSSSDITNEIKKLSDEELNQYAKDLSLNLVDSPSLLNEEVNVPEHLKIVSDEELQQYLKENNIEEQTDTINAN
jgi:hypothetical protein